jgi:hypothetical protein
MRTSKTLAMVLALAACNTRDSAKSASPTPTAVEPEDVAGGMGGKAEDREKGRPGKMLEQQSKLDDGKRGDRDHGPGRAASDADEPAAPAAEPTVDDLDGDQKLKTIGGKDANRPEGITRAWFPETFLFAPLVVTDANGDASIKVRVPDRLTSWRVLALAHARNGAQAGDQTSFLGTLPIYVDPIVPPTLVAGDDVRIPIQIVNTTDAPIATRLDIAADGATVTGAAGARTVPAHGSEIAYARIVVARAGKVTIRVALGSTDAVVKTIDVVPAGKPITTLRSGTLAAPRTLAVDGPAGSDPATDRVRLVAYPGALAVLRSELGVSTSRTGVAEDAYALLLAGRATSLLTMLGDQADAEAVRELALLTAQRAIRAGRMLDVPTATLLTEAALAHPGNPVLQRLGQRAAEHLSRAQLADGTFKGEDGWTVQRVLVATAEATRAAKSSTATDADRQRATAVATRAGGAFERLAIHVEDPYTAAAILATGTVGDTLAATLRDKVKAAIATADDGAKYLEPGEGVVRPDGLRPSRIEATALAVLALQGDATAPLADLGATLLGAYNPVFGWGDGRTNLVALRAVVELFRDPMPDRIEIAIKKDGAVIASGVLDGTNRRDALRLEAPAGGLAGAHTWEVVATPPVPGLGFSLALDSWVPWPLDTVEHGLELALPAEITGAVGKPATITLTAVAPGGIDLHIRQALPTGVQIDTPSLEALVEAGTISSFTAADGSLDLYVPALDPGELFTAKYRVVPTLAGTLHTTASSIEAGPAHFDVPPTTWTIR